MFILLTKDDFFGYEIVLDYIAKPKLFQTEQEAVMYAGEFCLTPFQVVDVKI